MATRPASKAGPENQGWYNEDPETLAGELDEFLANVPETIDGSSLPIPGARIIIAPHAGYFYSGQNAAWAYSCFDLSKAKRVFILGPSHTQGFHGCRVTAFGKYATPFGDLTVDRDTIERIKQAGEMMDMVPKYEMKEHSLEMHLPYLYKRCEQTFESPEEFPRIVPIIVGNNDREAQKDVGRLLLSYLQDEENAFIISSDFCHWGWEYYDFTVYAPEGDINRLTTLYPNSPKPSGPPIYETIRLLDEAAMDAIKSGSQDAFVDNIRLTRNTVCGRHPIGIAMAALELYAKEIDDQSRSRFKIVRYNRSSQVEWPTQSSVSYVSAYANL